MNYFSLLSKSATLFNPVVPSAPFLYHLKTKPYGFMMFLGGREMVHWEQIKKKIHSTMHSVERYYDRGLRRFCVAWYGKILHWTV